MVVFFRWLAVFLALSFSVNCLAQTEPSSSGQQVMENFRNVEAKDDVNEFSLKKKHQVMFFMGLVLLVLIIATAVFGILMGVFGKPVFVPHMVTAGLSVTLAVAHSVVAVVWFFPF